MGVLTIFLGNMVLEDISDKLPGLKRRPGLTTWRVCLSFLSSLLWRHTDFRESIERDSFSFHFSFFEPGIRQKQRI
jgi:hypothetical protein